MSLVEITSLMFGAAIVLFLAMVVYAFVQARKHIKMNRRFQQVRVYLATQLKEDYDDRTAKLYKNVGADLLFARNVPLESVKRTHPVPATFHSRLLSAREQAFMITWLLNFETYPADWKVNKIRVNRSAYDVIEIAKNHLESTPNQVLTTLAYA